MLGIALLCDNHLSLIAGTPLSEEDSDALQRLLQNANVKLSSSQLTFEKVQKQLTERGCDELAKNLRQELNKG